MGKPIVISCVNHKGGSGKSSLAGSLIAVLAEKGYRVLGVDGDMQCNLTSTYGLRKANVAKNFFKAIEDVDKVDEYNGADYIIPTEYENIDFIPSHDDMALLEMNLMMRMAEREKCVFKLIESLNETRDYDFIVFDTNPTLGLVNFNIFVASDYLIIPVEASAYGVDGLGSIVKFFQSTRRVNKNLKIAGIVMNKVDSRKNITKDATDMVKDIFGEIIFDTFIGIDTSIEKSQWDQVPLLMHSPKSRISEQYRNLTEEVLTVVKQQGIH